jgi:hypothetical protein
MMCHTVWYVVGGWIVCIGGCDDDTAALVTRQSSLDVVSKKAIKGVLSMMMNYLRVRKHTDKSVRIQKSCTDDHVFCE